MTGRVRVGALCLLLIPAMRPMVAQEGCGVARDLVVQALENLKGGQAVSDLEDGIQLFKQAVQGCPTLGDAWYYRSLFEDKLKHKPQAAFALQQAKIVGSEAMTNEISPFTLAAPPNAQQALRPVAKKYALVVGISKFKNAKAGNLNWTSKDAKDLSAFLLNSKLGRFESDNVKTLTDEQATLANVKADLNWIGRRAEPADLVVVFIASHGVDRGHDKIGHLSYVLASDTDDHTDDSLFGSAMPMTEISNIIRSRIKAERTVVFLDTCYSEGGTEALVHPATASNETLEEMKAGFGRAIIASSKGNQKSQESDQLSNGIFTHFLIEALTQKDGKISLADMFGYVKEHVESAAKTERHAEQTPVMVRSDQGGEIVIGVEPAGNKAATNRLMPLPSEFAGLFLPPHLVH